VAQNYSQKISCTAHEKKQMKLDYQKSSRLVGSKFMIYDDDDEGLGNGLLRAAVREACLYVIGRRRRLQTLRPSADRDAERYQRNTLS